MHHLVDQNNADGDVDEVADATTGWSKSARTPVLLQRTYGIGTDI